MQTPSHPNRKSGFTLIELVIVIVILGILAAVAIPRFFDFTGDAKAAACHGALGGTRSAISVFHARSATPDGGGVVAWPTLTELLTDGAVLVGGVPDNPYSTNPIQNTVVPGVTKGTPTTPGTMGGWCYKPSTGEFWANTASGNGEAGF